MIQLKNVSKIYKTGSIETVALKEACLEIKDGEMIAIMGTSGSGKTTLLNVIGCMDKLTSGAYLYGDVEVHRLNQIALEQFRKEHISFVFQQFALLSDYTVYENVELPLRAKNIPRKQRKERIMNCLTQLDIADLKGKLPSQISGGQQQRCAIARALVAGGDMILADEPTGALDSKTSNEIMDILCRLHKEEKKTVILVTHDRQVAERAERIIRIEDGICMEEG